MPFVTEYDLGSKIQKYWRVVTGHLV
jgi:hypothetical protein